MEVRAHLEKGRCFFGDFTPENDIDKTTKRSGLSFFRFNIIGSLLHRFGLAHKIHVAYGQKHGIVYLPVNSYERWKKRHFSELNEASLNQAIIAKEFEKVIQIICENSPLREISLSYRQLLAEAEQQFADHPFKKEILEKIEFYLNCYQRNGSIQFDLGTEVFSTDEARDKDQCLKEALDAFFCYRELFKAVTFSGIGNFSQKNHELLKNYR